MHRYEGILQFYKDSEPRNHIFKKNFEFKEPQPFVLRKKQLSKLSFVREPGIEPHSTYQTP